MTDYITIALPIKRHDMLNDHWSVEGWGVEPESKWRRITLDKTTGHLSRAVAQAVVDYIDAQAILEPMEFGSKVLIELQDGTTVRAVRTTGGCPWVLSHTFLGGRSWEQLHTIGKVRRDA